MSKAAYLTLAIITILIGSCVNFSLTTPDDMNSRSYSSTGGFVGGFSGGHK